MTIESRFIDVRIRREKSTFPNANTGLPQGAVRSLNHEIRDILALEWIESIAQYNITKVSDNADGVSRTLAALLKDRDIEVEASSSNNPTFNNQLTPKVEGYDWYRGFAFKSKETQGEVFIFTGWMQPWYDGGAPDPIVFTRGNVNDLHLFLAVKTYAEVSRALRHNQLA